jgi:hypothetical protein
MSFVACCHSELSWLVLYLVGIDICVHMGGVFTPRLLHICSSPLVDDGSPICRAGFYSSVCMRGKFVMGDHKRDVSGSVLHVLESTTLLVGVSVAIL